mmetsp:Transcript_22479/g.33975  ORF Transcript_22479/g.33975 Transcript_22479/m.33975 type:complete len:90 (-) Transcript_22479:1328-1597(-)
MASFPKMTKKMSARCKIENFLSCACFLHVVKQCAIALSFNPRTLLQILKVDPSNELMRHQICFHWVQNFNFYNKTIPISLGFIEGHAQL